MSNLRPASSEESLKDWTFVAADATLKNELHSSDDETPLDDADVLQESVLLSRENADKTPDRDVVGDSDADFVRIDEDPDDHLDEWVNSQSLRGSVDESLNRSFLYRPHCDDDGEPGSEECLEGESEDETESSSLGSDDEEDDEMLPLDGDELPDDYPQGYCSMNGSYTHTRNNQMNDWLSTVLFIVLAVVTGLAVGHFFGSDGQAEVINQEVPPPLGRPVDFHRTTIERPPAVVLSDVQKSQAEITKQLQEMMKSQGDLKQRIGSLEEENRDLRLRLLENRKRCTRIIHKPYPSLVSSSALYNYSSQPIPSFPEDLTYGIPLKPSQNFFVKDVSFQKPSTLPLTISAVVVPPKHAPAVISTSPFNISPVVTSTIQLQLEPFYYPLVDLEELSRAALSIPRQYEWDTQKGKEFVKPLKELVRQRKVHKDIPAAPKSVIIVPPVQKPILAINKTRTVENASTRLEERNAPVRKVKNDIKADLEKIKENRRKFEEEYAEFKLRWKNVSRDARKEERPKESRKGCAKAKMEEDCEDGYCYTAPKKFARYEKKQRAKENRFFDSLPPMVRKHLTQNNKIEKILKSLGSDITKSKLFQQVVEEVPKRLKMSSDWWECQWSWWQNFARNRHVSAYSDCAGYLTSWQNRYKQNTAPAAEKDFRPTNHKKNKSIKHDLKKDKIDRTTTEDWIWRRAALRAQTRLPRDWTFLRAAMREQQRGSTRSYNRPLRRVSNSSWWFFERARDRNEQRHHHVFESIPRDPIYAFLRHRAMFHGSVHP